MGSTGIVMMASRKYTVENRLPKSSVREIWPMHTGVSEKIDPVEKPYSTTYTHSASMCRPNGSQITKFTSTANDIVMIVTLKPPRYLSAT